MTESHVLAEFSLYANLHGRAKATGNSSERLLGFAKKLVDSHTLAKWADEDGFAKGCDLIRANLHGDIDKIETKEEWARCYCQAIWLERWRNWNRAEMIARLFGEGKS